MNTVNSVVERRKPSWIDYSRASRAQKTLDARNDSFKMNAFGNTVVVKDYTVLRQVGAIGAEEVKSLLQNHAAHLRNFVGRILQIGIHCKHYLSLSCLKTAVECSRLAIVASKANCLQPLAIGRLQGLYNAPR